MLTAKFHYKTISIKAPQRLAWGRVWQLLKKLNTEVAHDPAILLLGACLRNSARSLTDPCTVVFTVVAPFIITQR